MRRLGQAGITVPELLMVLAVTGIVSAFGVLGYAQYRESISARRAAEAIAADVQVARSLAIQTRSPISLVATEAQRRYVVRDTAGNEFHWRDFDAGSDIRLTGLDVATAGDSLTFDSRGILLSGNTAQVTVTRRTRVRTVTLNALGRSIIN